MEHFPYLFAAFAIVWGVIFFYVLGLDRRARRAERDLEDIRQKLGKDER